MQLIRDRLENAFSPDSIQVEDEGHKHVGHEGAKDGRGHFRVRIVSNAFRDLTLLQRHRAVYRAMGEMMQTDIHALIIEACTPDEQ